MVIDFSVHNVGSIKDEVTFSFEADDEIKELADYYVVEPVPGIKLLKLALIYGANASGKSTVLQAFELLKSLLVTVKDAKNVGIDYEKFKLDPACADMDSSFSMRFIVGAQCYRYRVVFNQRCVVEEDLVAFDGQEETPILHRDTDMENQLAVFRIAEAFRDDADIEKKCQDGVRWNETVFAGFQHVNARFQVAKELCLWIEEYLYPIIDPQTSLYSFVCSRIEDGSISKDNVVKLLRKADFMIEDVQFKDDKKADVPERIKEILDFIEARHPEIAGKTNVQNRHAEFMHVAGDGGRAYLEYEEESLGTRRFYQFCGLLDLMVNTPGCFAIDEIDTSMHPDLLEFFLLVYLSSTSRSQIVATTHYRELLLNRELFRPDIIWFTEKKTDGGTELYSLLDFDPAVFGEANHAYYYAYKHGKLGAKPRLGDYFIDLKHHGEKSDSTL